VPNDLIILLTSVKAYQTPLFSDIITLATIAKKENAKGLIISNQKLSTEIMEKSLNEGIDIWGFDQLSNIISRLFTLPFLEDYIVKVKEGKYEGFFGLVKSLNFTNKRSRVYLLNYPTHPTLSYFSRDLQPLSFPPNSEQYRQFIKDYMELIDSNASQVDKIKDLTDIDEYDGAFLIRNIFELVIKEDEERIILEANIENHRIKFETFYDKVDRISCDCSHWSYTWTERKVCRHIASMILRLCDDTKDKLLKYYINGMQIKEGLILSA
jgi:hypothetical protein